MEKGPNADPKVLIKKHGRKTMKGFLGLGKKTDPKIDDANTRTSFLQPQSSK